eukprot:TRINITY_DN2103_c0_g1_i1.p1 TRINITY_DN2103_c0_g1~~TRINITY_DN2103_c0_g1_i1.p1  ORF type:complete len:705 (+),score=329.11 TRINITY_DN2103_c0_g1_i1:82-2196(+)
MKLAAVSTGFAVAAASSHQASPVEKVLQLLGDLEAKVIKEGEASQITFAKFSQWCEDRAKNLDYEITTGTSEVQELGASIEHATSEIASLESKIEETAASMSANDADLKAAESIRAKEKKDFTAEEKELSDTISALDRAIVILEREMQKGGSAALAQLGKAQSMAQVFTALVDASMLQQQDVSRLTALVQNGQQAAAGGSEEDQDDSDLVGAPDPAAYKSHSGNIVETLEGLLEKGKDMLEEARKKEANAQHNFDMLKQSLSDELKFSGKDMDKAKKDMAQQKEAKAGAEGEMAITKKDLEEGKKLQGTLQRDCTEKAQDFEAETKSRSEELKALATAKQAIQESTGGAADITYSGASFLQFIQSEKTGSSLRTELDLANFELVHFVRDLAEKQHSENLMQLSRRIAAAVSLTSGAGADPFAKVKKLIQDMLERLEQDAQTDASHKAYCDKEMGDTMEKKADKEASIDKLTTAIDAASSRSAQLKEEVADLQQSLAQIAKSQAEMDSIRQEEKALHKENKAELEAGLEGVKMALRVLREYYAKDSAHTSAEGTGASIIGLLEVVESDFTKNAAEMTAAEATAQAEYERDTKENQLTKATKDKDVEYKTRESVQLDAKIREDKSDRDGVQTELTAILEYKAHLVQACVAKPSTYDERKSAREAEIAGLKEALQILEGEAVLLQKHAVGHRLRGGKRELSKIAPHA